MLVVLDVVIIHDPSTIWNQPKIQADSLHPPPPKLFN